MWLLLGLVDGFRFGLAGQRAAAAVVVPSRPKSVMHAIPVKPVVHVLAMVWCIRGPSCPHRDRPWMGSRATMRSPWFAFRSVSRRSCLLPCLAYCVAWRDTGAASASSCASAVLLRL